MLLAVRRTGHFQAAVLDFQFKDYAGIIAHRRAVADVYQARLGDLKQVVLPPKPGAHPDHFDVFRTVAYYAYYQNPVVIAAIRVLGHDYNDAPQPRGYVLPPFDPTPGVDVPVAPRGWYKRTEDVARLDVSGLSVLRQDQVKEA